MKFFAAIMVVLALNMTTYAAEKVDHVVSLKFKSTASPADVKKVENAFRALKSQIPEIVSLEWGTNISNEKRDQGFTHCFILSFKSQKDRDTYLNHPRHEDFKKLAGPFIEDVFVIDFVAKH